MKYPLAIFFFLLFLSCSRGEQGYYSRYTTFESEQLLCAETITLDTILFRYPFRIAAKGGLVIIMDLHNADNFYHAFSYPEWTHVVSFGKRGQAPEEMLSAETLRFCSPDSVWALDANKMEITRWEINKENRTAKQVEAIPLDQQLIRTLDFLPMDSGFFVPDYTGKYRYSKIDTKGILSTSEGSIPTEKKYKDIAQPALAQGWRSFIDYNPKKQKLVMATQLGEVLEIYDLKEGSKKVIYGPHGEPEFQISTGHGIPTGIMGFSDVKITDNYIYTVFHGQSFDDIIKAETKGEPLEDGGRYIYVFDLEGRPVKQYTLDHAIYGIDVNEETGIITGTDVNSNNPIITYKIGESVIHR